MSLVIGTDTDAEIWRLGNSNKWELLHYLPDHSGTVRNVAWSNSLGKNYETIATACSVGLGRRCQSRTGASGFLRWRTKAARWSPPFGIMNAMCYAEVLFDVKVWRIEWNTTGTVLASSGDDNKVRLWKERFDVMLKWVLKSRGLGPVWRKLVRRVCFLFVTKLFQFLWILLRRRLSRCLMWMEHFLKAERQELLFCDKYLGSTSRDSGFLEKASYQGGRWNCWRFWLIKAARAIRER